LVEKGPSGRGSNFIQIYQGEGGDGEEKKGGGDNGTTNRKMRWEGRIARRREGRVRSISGNMRRNKKRKKKGGQASGGAE